MATIGNIINLVDCGLSAVLGTGTKGCRPFFKKVTALSFLPAGFKLDKERVLDEEYFTELQASGKLIHIKGIRDFTDNSTDDTLDELGDGVKQVSRYGLYEFLVNFVNGLYFHSALTSLNSFGDYDVIMWDIDGNGLGTKASNGSLKGLSVGMIQASKLTFGTNDAGEREGLAFQLLNRRELDTDYVFISADNIDFNANIQDGINEIELSFAKVPADGDTDITLRVVTKQDSQPVDEVTFEDFIVKKDGATMNPTAGDDSVKKGDYVLEVGALSTNDRLVAQIYDNTLNQAVVMLDEDLYKSNEATAVVI